MKIRRTETVKNGTENRWETPTLTVLTVSVTDIICASGGADIGEWD